MNERITSIALYLTILILIISSGCDLYPVEEDFSEFPLEQQKLQTVETLKLTKAKPSEPIVPEANEVPPEKIELTLEQCRAFALQNNLELKVQLINPAIAAERVSEEEAKFESVFVSDISGSKTNTPAASFLDEIAGSKVENVHTDFGVQVPLRTGGNVRFDLADNWTKTDATFMQFNPIYSTDMAFSISQPLLRGAGKRANTYTIRLAGLERQITDARTKLEVIRVVAALDRVYWRLYAARRELDVRRKQYELAQAQLEQARRFVNSGQRAPVEVIRAEAGVAQQLEAIIVAENNLRDRERELKRVINKAGLEMQTPTEIITITEPDPVRYELDRDQFTHAAIENRGEMLDLELQIAQAAITVEYLRNQALPLVTLDYSYNINGLGSTRADAYDLLFEDTYADHRVGLQLLVPLGNKANRSRLLQAFYQRHQRLADRDNRKALIELEVLNAIDQVEANWQRILASRQRSILDGRLFEAEKRQFELGLSTSTDVLEAQTTFADAQSAEILALAEYQIALVDLAHATGTLLGAAKIQWQPIVPETG